MRILVIGNEPPWPLCYGGRLHGYELCRRLARAHELLLVAERSCEVDDPPLPFPYQVGCASAITAGRDPDGESPPDPPLSRVERFFGIDPDFTREVVRFAGQWRPDVVIGMNYRSLAYLSRIRGVPTICDLLDDETLHRLRELLGGRATSKWADLKCLLAAWAYQRRLIPKVTAVTVLSEIDARFCRRHTRHRRVECIPHGVDCDHYRPMAVPEDENRVIFWGSLTFGPNIAAILMFAEKVWPLVLKARPQARWTIIGRGDSPLLTPVRRMKGVDYLGYVDDLRPHAAGAAVAVVPMVSGAGIKNKIMEAWALARPVLCTPTALGDLPGVHGHNVWLARRPRELADGLLTLLADRELRRRLGWAGRQTALRHCSWDRAAEAFERLCRDVAGGSPEDARANRPVERLAAEHRPQEAIHAAT
ncbi:MAG: glycosyltransferase [Phycisphaerae bacterium]|jgi:glycosyltransferase involved in cell wall biosynthesis